MLVEQKEDVTILKLEIDHLDTSNFAGFKQDVEGYADGALRVVLDTRSLRFVDSAGLGAILSILRRLGQRGGSLKISGVSRPVSQLFDLVRLRRIIEMYDTAEEAVRAFQS